MATLKNYKPEKRPMAGKKFVRVACVQAPQVVFNKWKQIEVACKYIKEAGEKGVELVAFSETYIPVFPAYYTGGYESNVEEWRLWNIGLQDNSIVVPSDETDAIGKACKEAGVYCVMGVNELDDADGVRTFYNTQIMFGKDGRILRRHRKLTPTYSERCYWGSGDGSDLGVVETDIGRIGSLICGEHHAILIRAAEMLMGEDFHIANYPGCHKAQSGEKFLVANRDGNAYGCECHLGAREYALEAGCFCLCSCGILGEKDFEPEYKSLIGSDHLNIDWAIGGSAIVGPGGEYVVKPVFDKEGLVIADCYADDIKVSKMLFDAAGHYSHPEIARLVLNTKHYTNLNIIENSSPKKGISYKDLKNLSEEFEVDLDKLERIATRIEKHNQGLAIDD